MNIILNSKIFWKKKFEHDGLMDYIPFLKNDDNILIRYNQFIKINNKVNKFIYKFKTMGFSINFSIKRGVLIYILLNTTNLLEFSNMIEDVVSNSELNVEVKYRGIYSYYLTSRGLGYVGEMTEKEDYY